MPNAGKLALAAALLASLLIAAAARGSIRIETVPDDGSRALDSVVALATDGSAHLVWRADPPTGGGAEDIEVRLTEVDTEGVTGPYRTVASGYIQSVDVSADRRGRGFVAWTDSNDVYVARLGTAGQIGALHALGGGDSIDVETTATGETTAMWRSGEGLLSIRLGRSGPVGEPSVVSRDVPFDFVFELDRSGVATVASFGDELRIVRVSAGAGMRATKILSRPAEHRPLVGVPTVDSSRSGAAAVAWVAPRRGVATVFSSTVSPKGEAGPVRDVTNGADRSAAHPSIARVAGGWFLAWSSATEERRSARIVGVELNARGRPGRARSLSPAADAGAPAVLGGSRAHLFWRHQAQGRGGSASCISHRKQSGSGRWGRVRRLAGTCPARSGPTGEGTSGGPAVLAWGRRTLGVISVGR
jgi:hypothetical protein